MKKLLPHEIPTKSCALCGATFSKRKPGGGIYTAERWAAKKCCSNACHTQYHWNQRKESIPDRFWRQVDKRDGDECWPWKGAYRDPRKGYGGFHWQGHKMMRAHRAAYVLTYGAIAGTLVVRHTCDNPPCCNPAHLQLGTVADNNRDRDSRGRYVAFERNENPRTKITTEALVRLKAEYAALPMGPSGRKRKSGTVEALARKYGIALTHLCRLTRT